MNIFSDCFLVGKIQEAIVMAKECGRPEYLDQMRGSIRKALAEGLEVKRVKRDYAPAGAFTSAPSWASAAALKRELSAPGVELETLYHYNSPSGEVPEKLRGRRRVVSVHSTFMNLSAANDSGHSCLNFKASEIMLLGENCFALTYTYDGNLKYKKTGKPVIVAVYRVFAPNK